MEEQITPDPIEVSKPEVSQSFATDGATQAILKQKPSYSLWIGITIGIFLMIGSICGGYLISQRMHSNNTPLNPPVTPTSKPVQIAENVNPVATTSAFLDLERSVKELTASISASNPIDSSVTAPVLDLPLGFSR
jgi:hypothetical protein